MRALVISGGGSKGAFAGGVSQFLIEEDKRNYDIFVGSSTGSLLIPLLAIGEVEKIKKAFTSVRQRDIYNISPFKVSKYPDGSLKKISINHFNTVRMFAKRKKSFGEHLNLRKTIQNTISKEDFVRIQNSGKKVVVTVSNISTTNVEYKYARDYEYDDFIDWMWASSSFVPFMNTVQKNDYEYADGGFGNYLPIEEAIDLGATEIDVVVLNPRRRPRTHLMATNAFDLLLKCMLFMQKQIAYNDILVGHLEGIYNKNVNINFIFTPRLLTPHSFYFDPNQMNAWWEEGYAYAKSLLD